MKIIINIGLNVGNTEPIAQLKEVIRLINPEYYRIDTGSYNGIIERTVIAKIEISLSETPDLIIKWCNLLNQDCISFKYKNKGYLIYNSNFEGKKQLFNDEYFIPLIHTGQTKVV